MMPKRARSIEDKAQKREEIKLAAKTLFMRAPARLPSVSQITQALNMTNGSIYKHYSSKEEIFLEVLKDEYEIWFKYIAREMASSRTFLNLLDALFENLLENGILINLGAKAPVWLEPNSSSEQALVFREFLGAEMENLAQDISARYSISKHLVIKNFIQSFSVIHGAFLASSAPEPQVMKKLSRKFLFPDFKLHAKAMLNKIWQY